jgi:transcription elongation factor GreA
VIDNPARTGASELMRSLGLMVDGPARWGNPVSSRSPGVFVVELPGGLAQAPIDSLVVRRWVDRVPAMLIDGEAATQQALARRLADFWLPAEPILYVGRSAKQIGGRLAAMYATELGDSRPHSGGHWLKALSALGNMRVWWAVTDAQEEFEDALIAAVAERADADAIAQLADPDVVLPYANLAAPDGRRKRHGIEHSLRAEATPPAPVAKGKRSTAGRSPAGAGRLTAASRARADAKAAAKPAAEPTFLSREGHHRLTAELDELRTNVRPGVIARVKAARELGDLRENADYDYARKEQSFVEGRIQTIEQMLKSHALIDETPTTAAARLGSTVVVESDGERQTYALVGPAEADPAGGRISYVSPVGAALVGAHAGDEVTVQLPRGTIRYRVIEVR